MINFDDRLGLDGNTYSDDRRNDGGLVEAAQPGEAMITGARCPVCGCALLHIQSRFLSDGGCIETYWTCPDCYAPLIDDQTNHQHFRPPADQAEMEIFLAAVHAYLCRRGYEL